MKNKRSIIRPRQRERNAMELLWNWVCIGACGSTKTHKRWLRTINEMLAELDRYEIEGCNCGKESRGKKV